LLLAAVLRLAASKPNCGGNLTKIKIMNKKTIILLLIALILVVTYSFLNIPRKFETEGGSCYQGITAMIIRFFLKVCGVLNLLSILAINYKSNVKTAKILSIALIIIWSIGTLIHSSENILIGVKYFTPLLILNFIIVILIYKIGKSNAESNTIK
jgi:hypothetical protein